MKYTELKQFLDFIWPDIASFFQQFAGKGLTLFIATCDTINIELGRYDESPI